MRRSGVGVDPDEERGVYDDEPSGAVAPFGDVNPALRVRDLMEANAVARFHVGTCAALLSSILEQSRGEAGASLSSEAIREAADGVGRQLRRAADVLAVFER